MRYPLFLAALAAGTAFAVPAVAQDAGGYDRESHFRGAYISGFAGVAAQNNDRNDTVVFDTNGDGKYDNTVNTGSGANAFTDFCGGRATSNLRSTGCSRDKDRVEYGGRIGYDMRAGNIVYGALVEASGNKILDGTSGFSSTPAFYEFTRQIDYNVSARARLGYTPNGGALFYVTGGISGARVDHRFRTSNTANSFTAANSNKWVLGYQAGGGAEVMLTNKLSLGIEYLYNRYNDDKYYVQVGQGTAGATNPFVLSGGNVRMRPSDDRFAYHSLRGTVSYHF